MDQVQTVQRPTPGVVAQPVAASNQMPQKKSGWFKWVIIILVILIVVGVAWWIFTT